jgi:Xaa-Pro dipeptidase
VTWEDTSELIARQRAVKSDAEIACVREAAGISSAAMLAGLDAVRVGVNARDIAAAVYSTMIGHGSDYPGLAPLIRFRDALLQEHLTWPDREVVPGDSIFFELSASVGRYHAPLSRMAYVGEPPDGTDDASRIATDALDAVTAALVPGTRSCDVYAAWQDAVNSGLGHDRYRRHHCGYQVGIGFPPSWVGGPAVVGLRSDSTWRVRAGMTFHILSWLLDQEPADYVLSDTVLVTPEGAQLLTSVSRDPIVVPS